MGHEKLIISAALTGAATNRSHCPYIPFTPKELGEESKRAVDAGASIVHIHAREDDGTPSWRTEVFEEIHEEVRKRCSDVIINFSTGAIGMSAAERTKHLHATKPDMAAFNMGSMNYAIFSKKAKQFFWNAVFENSFDTMMEVVKTMNENQVTPEMECFDTGHIRNAEPQLAAVACTMCGNFRVGLEDNFYLPNNEMAKSNGECVEWGVKLANMMGREVATIEEARVQLKTPLKETV